MDFHRLARKDLQSLCKLNKLPANKSNIAMADALASLTIVNGIENFCGTTESSVPDKTVFMSAKTRRRNRGPVASLHTVHRVYNTRLSARLSKKTLAESENKECVRVEQLSETLNQKIADKDLNLKGTAATYLESKVLTNKGEGLKVDSVETVVQVPSQSIKAVLDMPVPKKKDDVVRDLSLSETDIPPEKQANEDVDLFQKIAIAQSDMLLDEPVHDDLMIKTESENILFKSNFSAANNMNIVDGVNSDFNLKIQDISCDVNSCGVYDTEEGLPSQYVLSGKPYSENCEGISSHNNSCDDAAADTDVMCAKQLDKEAEEHVSENHNCNNSKEIIYKSVMKISSDSSNVFSGGKRSAEGKSIFQKGVGGLTFGVDIQSNTTTYENTENYIIEKNSFDDTEVGLDFLQQNISCKLFDSKRQPEVCEILSCNNAKEFFVPSSEMAGSVEYTENVSRAVSSDDELGDKHIFAFQEEDSRNVSGGKMVVDLETSSKTHAGIERKSINFQVLGCTYPKDAADQSATPDSYDLSDGFSGEITIYDEKGSGKSSNGTRLLVASDVSCSFLDLENIFADESQPANAEKSPASIKPSSCICPSSLPPSLQACETKNSAEELSETDMPLEVQAIEGTNDVGVDSSFFGSEMQTESSNKVEGFQVDAVEAVVEVPSHNNKAAIDLPLPEKKDDVVLELSLSEIDMPPEVQATEEEDSTNVSGGKMVVDLETSSKTHAGIEGKSINFQVLGCTYPKDAADQSATPDSYDLSDGFSGEITTYDEKGSGKSSDEKSPASIKPSSCICPSSLPPSLQACETKNSAEELSETDMPFEVQAIEGTNDVGVDSSFFESEMQTESSNNVEGFQVDAVEAVVEVPSHNNKAAIDLPLPEKKDDVLLELSLSEIDMPPEVQAMEGPNDVRVDSSLFGTEIRTESSNRVDGENLEAGVISSTYMRAEIFNGKAEGEFVFQDGFDGLAFGVDMQSNTATYENTENYTREKNMSSKLFDSNKEPKVCKILSCNNSKEFSVSSEMAGSIEYTVNFSGVVLSDDELGDKPIFSFQEEVSSNTKEIADQSEMMGEVDSSNTRSGRITSDDETELDFQEAVGEKMVVDLETSSKTHAGIERESIISQVLNCTYPKEATDQSATPDSYDLSDGFADEISDVSCSFLDLENIGSNMSQPPYVENSPAASLKPSSCICPSTAPPSLQACGTKINDIEAPLILPDHPFTEKYSSSNEQSSSQFANTLAM